MVTFKEVNKDNFKEIINLKLADNQTGFLENNLYSMAECKVDPRLVPMGIYDGDMAVGFILHYFQEDEPNYVYLKRLMIDKDHQGKGYGKAAMKEALRYFKENYPIACVELMHYPDNLAGAALYDKFGFEPTGEIWETEIVKRRYYEVEKEL